MPMTKLLHRLLLFFAVTGFAVSNGVSAQILPVLNSFSNRTFQGTIDVSWPVEFSGCTFVVDSVVLRHSYGAVFRNCRFESRSGVLYIAGSGDGMILSDCEVTGCDRLMFSREYSIADRNYLNEVRVNGDECTVLEDQETITDIEGLDLSESVNDNKGPLFMLMSTDRKVLKGGETASMQLRGLEKGMFAGWQSSDTLVSIKVGADAFECTVCAPETVTETRYVLISAYTEYGLEAACVLTLMPEVTALKKERGSRSKRNR